MQKLTVEDVHKLRDAEVLDVEWQKPARLPGYRFDADFSEVKVLGVYLIWLVDKNGKKRSIRSGQGKINERLKAHQNDDKVNMFGKRWPMYVTWARISRQSHRDGVEKFLHQFYRPLRNKQAPRADPIRPRPLPLRTPRAH